MFEDDAMGVTQIKEGFHRLKSSITSEESDQRSGRPQTTRNAAVVDKVENLITKDRLTSDCEISSQAAFGGIEKLYLAVSQDILGIINAAPGFLQLLDVPENENALGRIQF
ncbi:hypothetical protein TNCV_995331 [Trichonephila clavipes]|nr:hypothetical protein TNCV_995331 [Trichonephila clavipes]